MIEQLTRTERQIALIILVLLALLGFGLAVAGRDDLIAGHGWLTVSAAVAGVFKVSLIVKSCG